VVVNQGGGQGDTDIISVIDPKKNPQAGRRGEKVIGPAGIRTVEK
jgi:hypothetical protein